MSKEICISTTPHETRLAILENDELAEIYYERENEYTLAGSIYKGRVTRVLPGMQSAFVDLGLERDAFLYVTDFLEEQDGGADFERSAGGAAGGASSGNGGGGNGGGQARREGGSGREGGGRESGSRENGGREGGGRESGGREGVGRENGGRGRQQPLEVAPVDAVARPAAEEGSDEGDSGSGTKRWRGRRGRRTRGFRPRGAEGEAAPAGADQAAGSAEVNTESDAGPIGGEYEAPAVEEYRVSAPPSRGRGQQGGHAAPSGERVAGPVSNTSSSRSTSSGERSASPAERSASPAAIVLPGESISKYGGLPEPKVSLFFEELPDEPLAAEFVPNFIPAKPSTLIETPIEWDGSSLFPGESRARRPQSAAVVAAPVVAPAAVVAPVEVKTAAAHEESAVHPDVPVAAAVETDVNREVDETISEAFHSGPVADFEAAEAEADQIAAREGSAQIQTEVPVAFAVPTPSAPIDAVPEVAAAPEVHEAPTHQHEELQPHVVSEPVALIHDEPEAVSAFDNSESHEPELVPEFIEETHEFEPESASASYRVDATAPSEFRVSSLIEEEVPAVEYPAATVEEAVHLETLPVATEIEYETEEQDEELDETNHDPQATEVADQLYGFAPGAGILEEEVIDDEEYDFEPIHAHTDEHDTEELEEETLEQSGAEIGDSVREAHLNHRLAVEPGTDEGEDEDDLEYGEVDLEEDSEEEGAEEDGASEEAGREGNGAAVSADGAARQREGGRSGERGGRRDGRRGERGGSGDRGGSRGGRPGQRRHGGGGGGRRASAQVSDLPIISELLKQGQEILVQIAKEPIAKKGARITSHIALPGRFLVFMPTVNHVGVSRKIDSDEERHRLKRILISEKGDASGGFIVRTAADGASEEELRADLRFLISLWNDIKQREESSKAPALIYHDLNLIERVLRDQVSDNFSTIWVDSEAEYERIVRFLNRFQPSLVRRVKLYTKETPLFEHFGITDEISKALKSKVWLKSGGSIVINQTEALVAIDINTGKYVGKTARLEDTILKTNLDAIPEIVRQIRLRDLGGIIVIDFIDMDERKNRNKVMTALEEALKADRAPSKVLQFNDFGLVAITRKRVKQSLERTLSIPCPVCTATGMVKSPVTVANEIYTELRKMQKHIERGDVMLRVNPEVVKTLKANNAKWLTEMEEMLGKTIIVKSDPALHPEQFDIH